MLTNSHGAQDLLAQGRQGLSEMAIGLQNGLCWGLSAATPFYVGPDICPVIGAASNDFQRIERATINTSDLPAPVGYCHFAQPVGLPLHVPTGEERDLVALSWSLLHRRPDGRYDGTQEPAFATHLQLFPWVRMPLRSQPGVSWLGSMFQIPLGALDRPAPDPHGRNSHRLWAVMGVFVTLCEFMRQRILVASSRSITNRQARRRIAKKWTHEPIVKVIELRRREHQQHQESSDASVGWHCQWLVRGHWRQQFFPSTGEHRPLWINPHVKGDPSKPLKTPRIVAYEVVR